LSSLKGRGRVKGVLRGSGCRRACVTGVSCFLVAADVRGERPGGSRTGRSPAARRAAPEASLRRAGREPDDRAAGNGSREPCGGIFSCSGPSQVPGSSGAGSAAGCSHPFACPGGGRGHGAVRVTGGGQAGSIKTAPAPCGAAGQTTRRPRARPLAGRAVHAARAGGIAGGGLPAGLDRQRICPSRRP